jgi:hypothetical protein
MSEPRLIRKSFIETKTFCVSAGDTEATAQLQQLRYRIIGGYGLGAVIDSITAVPVTGAGYDDGPHSFAMLIAAGHYFVSPEAG